MTITALEKNIQLKKYTKIQAHVFKKNYVDRKMCPCVHVIFIYAQTIYCSRLCDNTIDFTECLFVKIDEHDNTLLLSWLNNF